MNSDTRTVILYSICAMAVTAALILGIIWLSKVVPAAALGISALTVGMYVEKLGNAVARKLFRS